MEWDDYFINMLPYIAAKSKDPNTQVGCIIVGPDNEIRSTGYNSLPRGLNDYVEARFERPEKYMWIEHADRNAIYNAARMGTSISGCRMYLPLHPCHEGARGIINSGISEVIIDNNDNIEYNNRWDDSIRISNNMLVEAGIIVRRHSLNDQYSDEYRILDLVLDNIILPDSMIADNNKNILKSLVSKDLVSVLDYDEDEELSYEITEEGRNYFSMLSKIADNRKMGDA